MDADLLTRVRHVHSASMFLQPKLAPHLPEVFRRARAGGATCSLDTNWDPAERWTGVLPLLEHTDVLFPNVVELLALTGGLDLDDAARRVVSLGCTVALKNGASGGILWTDTETMTEPASPVDAVDTTGAGDVHTGAFLACLLRGASAVEAARRANAVAARWVATGSYGG